MNNNKKIRDDKDIYLKRLKRISGQINGISKMIDNDRHCKDILIQISAVDSALKSLGKELLLLHMKTCVVDEVKKGNIESMDEVMDLCNKLI